MKKEGEVRISSGCAISGIFRRDGKRISGEAIRRSIAVMHDRSNGLGGGFAAYGIYPQYKDHFALHIFYDSQSAREETERFLECRFDIINLSKIPVRRTAAITDAPLIWRYFITPLPHMLQDSQLDEEEYTSRAMIGINGSIETRPDGGPAHIRSRSWTCRSCTTARYPHTTPTAGPWRCTATRAVF